MPQSITVKELQPRTFWIYTTSISLIGSLLFFIFYWFHSDPFWSSIFQLIAFVFFVLFVIGVLKLVDKPLNITLTINDDLLNVTFRDNNKKTVLQQEYSCNNIQRVYPTQQGRPKLNTILLADCSTLKVKYTDRADSKFLFKFSGRLLYFNPESIEAITQFLQQYDIDASVNNDR